MQDLYSCVLKKGKFYMKRNVYIMYAISLLQGMVFYAPVATLYRTAQGLSVFQITLIESISLILCFLLEIPWGIIADKIGYRKTMLVCCGLYFISKIIFWQASDFSWFLLERILLSIVISGLSGVDTSILYLSCEEGESQKIFGIYNSLGTIGLLGSSIIYSLFVGENFRMAGALTVISYGLAMVAALCLKEVNIEEKYEFNLEETKNVVKEIIKNKSVLIFLIAVAFLSETHQIITVFLNQLQYERCGMISSTIGYAYTVGILASLFGIFSAWFTKKQGVNRTGIIIFITIGIACFILVFTERAMFSVLSILLIKISYSIFEPFQLELQNRQISTDKRATALSINAMFIDCICVGINLIFGLLAEVDLCRSFLFGFILCFIGLLLFISYNNKMCSNI